MTWICVCVCVFQVSCTTRWCRSTSAYVETPPVTLSMLVVSRVSGLVCRRRVWGHTVRWGVKTGSKQSQQKTFNGVTVRATPLRLGNKYTLLGPFSFFASYCCWKKNLNENNKQTKKQIRNVFISIYTQPSEVFFVVLHIWRNTRSLVKTYFSLIVNFFFPIL